MGINENPPQNDCRLKETKDQRSWKYDILHEIGHLVCGDSCCREHAEFEAHGAAKTLCFVLGIDIGDAEERMNGYAGRSAHDACGRIERTNNA